MTATGVVDHGGVSNEPRGWLGPVIGVLLHRAS
jgi:hypothetical protein